VTLASDAGSALGEGVSTLAGGSLAGLAESGIGSAVGSTAASAGSSVASSALASLGVGSSGLLQTIARGVLYVLFLVVGLGLIVLGIARLTGSHPSVKDLATAAIAA